MTRDRDEKRLVRAKAERERTSYVEARRRFDRSGGAGGCDERDASTRDGHPFPPIRTTPIMQQMAVGDITFGVISVEEQPGIWLLRTMTSRQTEDRWMSMQVGTRRVEWLSAGNCWGSGWFEGKGPLDLDAELFLQVGEGRDQPPTDEGSIVLRPHPNQVQEIPYVAPASYDDWASFTVSIDAQGAHPQWIDCTIRPLHGRDEPPHFVTSIEHWAACSVLNIAHDDPSVQGTRIRGFFGAVDSKGRRYESWGGEGGSWGNGMTSRHWMVPRIAGDAGELQLFRRRTDELRLDKMPFAAIELG